MNSKPFASLGLYRLIFVATLSGCLLLLSTGNAAALATEPPTRPDGNHSRYLQVVQRACDALLLNARDRYGSVHTGMILSVLDRHTAEPLEALPPAPFGVRTGDRTGVGGSNANLQQDLYRTLQHLSRLTGDMRYERAVREALVDFINVTQHLETGLLAWGEHLYWNCVEDRLGDLDPMRTHEPKRKFIYFDYLYALEPERVLRYARGLWDHQISNHETGDFSRHAKYDRHAPGKGWDFPKEGSYFIDTWSRAYAKTQDPVYQTAVRVMTRRYLGRMNALGLLDWDTTNLPGRQNQCVTPWLISLALESADATTRMDPETRTLLERLASGQDRGFLSLPHEPDHPERGFLNYVRTDTGERVPQPHKQSAGYSQHWGLGYGVNSTAMIGLLCFSRQEQLEVGAKREAYRDLVRRAADLYRSVRPVPAEKDIWAGEYGMVILVELAAFRLTGEQVYLNTATQYANEAIEVFWGDNAPLPRASSGTDHYEVISYPDTLLLALLAMHEHVVGLEPKVEISDLNR